LLLWLKVRKALIFLEKPG